MKRQSGKSEDRKFIPRRRKKRPCYFCVEKVGADYKNIEFVRKFITDRGKIAPRRMTGCCALHQRMIMREIKKARAIGLAPFVVD